MLMDIMIVAGFSPIIIKTSKQAADRQNLTAEESGGKERILGKVAVVYYSGTGNTQEMAEAVAEGAKAEGAQTDLFECSDFNEAMAVDYTGIALGCPAMGDEELEDSEFQPLYDVLKPHLQGKKVALFGSYGWGDGEWMRKWEGNIKGAGIALEAESVICNESPDEDGLEQCRELGKAIAG